MEEVLRQLGINLRGEMSRDGQYVIDIADGDEFGKYYSILDKSSETEELEPSSLLTIHNASVMYRYKDYQIGLIGDFDQNTYKMVITKFNKSDFQDYYEEDDKNEDENEKEEE